MALPTFTSKINSDGTAVLTDDDGRHQRIDTPTVEEARRHLFEHVSSEARKRESSLKFVSVEDEHTFHLVIHPDGTVEELPDPPMATTTPQPPTEAPGAPEFSAAPAPTRGWRRESKTPVVAEPPAIAPIPPSVPSPPEVSAAAPRLEAPSPAATSPGVDHPEHVPFHRPPTARRSFIEQHKNDAPARNGWRGFLTKLGIRMAPSDEEQAERADIAAVSQHWPGPRTIAITNPKGGVGKTSTTVLISAVFGRYGGSGVLAWDNNQTRGTLGWRTEQGPHEATLLDMLPYTDWLLSAQAQIGDTARFVHHQRSDKYDVLRSKPSEIATGQRVSPDDVRALHAVGSKYYRLILMDSGNDESDLMWLTMIDLSKQLVLATSNRVEHAEAGALMLETLAKLGPEYAELARNAVVIISVADKEASKADVQNIVDGFTGMVRDILTIPYDPAIIDGHLAFDNLRPATQRAALAAAAAIARGLD